MRRDLACLLCWLSVCLPASVDVASAEDRGWTSLGPDGGTITALVIDPKTPATLYAGTAFGGVFKSTNGGGSWDHSGPPNVLVQALAIDPKTPSNLFAGTWSAGLFRSTDGGSSWSQTGLPYRTSSGMVGTDIRAIVVDPVTPSTVYVAAFGGVYKSTDGGETWKPSKAGLSWSDVRSLVIDPSRPATLYAGTSPADLFRSDDAGASWTRIAQQPPALWVVRRLVIDPANPAALYAGVETGGGLYRSLDAGTSWTRLWSYSSVDAIAMDAQQGILYVGSHEGIYRSTNAGAAWSRVYAGPISALATHPLTPGTVYASVEGTGVVKSTDGGTSWQAAYTGLSNTFIQALAVESGATGTGLYAGGSRLLKRTDASGNWTVSTTDPQYNLLVGINAIALDPTAPGVVLAGGTGIFRSADGGTTWSAEQGVGAVLSLAVAPTTPATAYMGTNHGAARSTDHGVTWTSANLSQEVRGWAVDPKSPTTVYAATQNGVYKSIDGGGTWKSLGGPTLLWTVAIDPAVSSTVYAGTFNGLMYRSLDGGTTWTDVSPAPYSVCGAQGDPYCVALAVAATAPTSVYVGNNYGVFKSIDSGAHWVPISTGLTSTYIRALATHPTDPTTLYAGTRGGGVYVYHDGGAPAVSSGGIVNAASFKADALAPESWASLFGSALAPGLLIADSVPLPTTLAGVTVHVTDGAGTAQAAQLQFVHPGQINFLVPAGMKPGPASLEVRTGGRTAVAPIQIETVAPGVFSANATGEGVAAAVAVWVYPEMGGQESGLVFECPNGAGSCTSIPLDLGSGSDQLILVLFGTGIRSFSSLPTVLIGGQSAEVLAAVPQGQYAGLDQINVRVPRSLYGRGEVEVAVTVAGKKANTVTINIGGNPGPFTGPGSGPMEFISIPAGEFVMGCSSGDNLCQTNENPRHRVKISKSLQMSKYEVTQAQWEAEMGSNPSQSKGADRPVEQVSWNDIAQFLTKLNGRNDGYRYRLPMEAEWEYAARAGSTGPYHGILGDIAWYSYNSNSQTHSVGLKRPNAWGLYDMLGNVWEWCQDWYGSGYYEESPVSDPAGPSSGTSRVVRGAGYDAWPAQVRPSHRSGSTPSNRAPYLGFRLVRERIS